MISRIITFGPATDPASYDIDQDEQMVRWYRKGRAQHWVSFEEYLRHHIFPAMAIVLNAPASLDALYGSYEVTQSGAYGNRGGTYHRLAA